MSLCRIYVGITVGFIKNGLCLLNIGFFTGEVLYEVFFIRLFYFIL